jgi:hypothetical protein
MSVCPLKTSPRLGRACPIGDDERNVLWRMSRHVPHVDEHIADLDAVAVARAVEREPCVDTSA